MSAALADWQRMWRELGAEPADDALYRRIVGCYSEPHRHYHTLQHLGEVLATFEGVRQLARHPAEIELALWFHDACYDLFRRDNEARSAQWAHDVVVHAGLSEDIGERVRALVLATEHDGVPEAADARLLVDVDLSILGAPAARFDESNVQIRKEYAHVPEPEYRRRRIEILRGFLDRPRLYGTEYFYERCEMPARANLHRALLKLQQPG